jgi:uncharacterized delta-60 repeat protein
LPAAATASSTAPESGSHAFTATPIAHSFSLATKTAGALAAQPRPVVKVKSGTVDSSFGSGGLAVAAIGTSAGAVAATVQPDGKIVTVGEATINGASQMISTRMLANGTMDSSYGNGGWVVVNINGSSAGNAIVLQPNGKIILAGTGNGNGALNFAAARLNPNGSLDTSFGYGGVATVPIGPEAIANAVSLQSDGKIVLGGMAYVGHNAFAAARLNASGSIDTSFGTGGVTTLAQDAAAWGMVLQADGKLVLGGEASINGTEGYMAARLLANGAVDSTYGQNGVVTIQIGVKAMGDAIALQSDGKVILAGSAYTNTMIAATVRLNTNGTFDQSFGTGGISSVQEWNGVNAVTVDGVGRTVIGAVGATAIRLNPNGTADQTFGTGGKVTVKVGTGDAANGVTVQRSTGNIILSGVAGIGGQAVLSVIRLAG